MSYHGSRFLPGMTDRVLIETGGDDHWYLPCMFVKIEQGQVRVSRKYTT